MAGMRATKASGARLDLPWVARGEGDFFRAPIQRLEPGVVQELRDRAQVYRWEDRDIFSPSFE